MYLLLIYTQATTKEQICTNDTKYSSYTNKRYFTPLHNKQQTKVCFQLRHLKCTIVVDVHVRCIARQSEKQVNLCRKL